MCFTKTCARSKKDSPIETTLTKVADSFLAKNSDASATFLSGTGQARISTARIQPPTKSTQHQSSALKSPIIVIVVKLRRKFFLSYKSNPDCWSMAVERPSSVSPSALDLAFARECGMESFRAVQKKRREVQTTIQADANRCTHRCMIRRRRLVAEQPTKILLAFCAQYGLDRTFVAKLIHEQFLLDEVSEPEEKPSEPGSIQTWSPTWKISVSTAAPLLLLRSSISSTIRSPSVVIRTVFCGMHPTTSVSRRSGNVPANKKQLKSWCKWPEPDECGLLNVMMMGRS
ncbi:hypothetical protein B0H13DRAFT_2539463 [Mycena leptocephala]|nr:hypothetical protein B0H13DRAFT_2539463 [Mycena leptocephala]